MEASRAPHDVAGTESAHVPEARLGRDERRGDGGHGTAAIRTRALMKGTVRRQALALATAALVAGTLASCSDDDHANAIPRNSIAVLAVDAREALPGADGPGLLDGLVPGGDAMGCGIDAAGTLYAFETPDGGMGLVAKVSSEGDLASWLDGLAGRGLCRQVAKGKGFRYTVVKDSWVVCFTPDRLVALGPVLPSGQAGAMRQAARYLRQDGKEGIKGSPLMERLEAIDAPLRLAARPDALPERLMAPILLGVPKDASASRLLFVAGMTPTADGCLEIRGGVLSTDEGTQRAIDGAEETFRPIKGDYLESMPSDAAAGVFMNVEGGRLLGLLHSSPYFQGLLAGLNTAIDMDKIIRSVDGDMAMVLPGAAGGVAGMAMGARLRDKDFLGDVDYWKSSCPAGSRIEDWGKDSYRYTDGGTTFHFGVSDNLDFFAGGSQQEALGAIGKAPDPLPEGLTDRMRGQRMCLVLNLGSLLGGNGQEGGPAGQALGNVLERVHTIIYFRERWTP